MNKRREYSKQYYQSNKEHIKAKSKERYDANAKEINESRKEYSAAYYQNNKQKVLKRTNEYNNSHKVERARRHHKNATELKIRVLTHYGNGKLACVRCAFEDMRALTIDHINGGGMGHRKILHGGGGKIYRWLEDNKYPNGYQTLCSNCNMIKMVENKESNISRRLIKK